MSQRTIKTSLFSSGFTEVFHQIRCMELRYFTLGDLLFWPSPLSKNCKYEYLVGHLKIPLAAFDCNKCSRRDIENTFNNEVFCVDLFLNIVSNQICVFLFL